MVRTIDVFKKNQRGDGSAWRKSAEERRDSWAWQKYSCAIALIARKQMKEAGITQQMLAEKLHCSQQTVSAMLSGKANLTLESIARLETALDCQILGKVDF